jgi:hypothetical protein
MRKLFTYLFIVFFSLGSVQAGAHYCVNMDAQKDTTSQNSINKDLTRDAAGSMSGDQTPCHSHSDEPTNEETSDNACCDNCESCASVVVTFNSLNNNDGLTYTEQYKQYGSFFILSNHIKIPTPPPNN